VPIGLTYIHGIGRTKAHEICSKVGIPMDRRVHEMTDDEVLRVRELIDREYMVEGDLRRTVAMNIKRLMDLGSYRGLRHRKGLRCAAKGRIPTRAPARTGASDRGQEEIGAPVGRATAEELNGENGSTASAATRAQEHHLGHRACRGDLQQHDDHDHRCPGQHDRVVVLGQPGFKGSRKSTPYAAQVAARMPGARPWSMACAPSTSR